ncbi:SDR family oxidoreductase [Mycolicibacterium aubagnense]|uniref:Short-chain dehydrogenase n=1 Tax=Mycolicibacterium aubagnense TaxID=319707 RepID=A0ABM7IDB2_9MYCO|nr:SDR family oxidoreductase [Mycolicibacterium aubagnense]WGI33551.1 SDR family oxidoreductase [Mycolicibacterium aubagnense]BBX84710.1 short-chain dehydrogenase [Mycolicibacterium aubagnense]
MQFSVQGWLTDRTVLITGGGSGIGKAIAQGVVAAGGNALIVGRTEATLQSAVDEISAAGGPGVIRSQTADVTNEDDVARAVATAAAWNGKLSGAVHCAGGSLTVGPVTHIDSEMWRQTVDLNVNGSMYVVKHTAREMVRGGGGSFVGISSIAASNTHRWFGPYGVTKSALDHLVQLAADELGASWVRANSIRPGLIRTDLVAASIFEFEPLREDYRKCTPLPRAGEVEDVANLALFLLSDASQWITGQLINVDGGQQLRRGPDFSAMMEPMFGADAMRGVFPQ